MVGQRLPKINGKIMEMKFMVIKIIEGLLSAFLWCEVIEILFNATFHLKRFLLYEKQDIISKLPKR